MNISIKQLIRKNKILFFGDDHNMNQGRGWLAKQIENEEININFVALEYIETSEQELINKNSYNELTSYLQKTYKEFPGFSPESVINLIKICKKQKIKVFALEMPEESFVDWKTKEAQTARKKFISGKIIDLSKTGKGIVLLGSDHVEKTANNVFNVVKNRLGNKLVSIIFIGGKNWTIDTKEYWIRRLELNEINKKTDGNLFSYKVTDKTIPTDWIIHFPQKEKY